MHLYVKELVITLGVNGSSGGSGVVILRFRDQEFTVGAGLTYTSALDGESRVLTFTAGSDTIIW